MKLSYNSDFCIAVHCTYKAEDDMKTIASCCSVVSLYWHCAFHFSYTHVFCCVHLSIILHSVSFPYQ